MRSLRRTRRQVVRDVALWVVLSALVAAGGPDPGLDPGAFLVVTVGRIVLLGVAVLVGRPWPLAAVVLLLPLGPWWFDDAFATVDMTWLPSGPRVVKVVPLSAMTPGVVWYAYLAGRRTVLVWPALAVLGVVSATGVAVALVQGGTLPLWITMVTGVLAAYVAPYLLGLSRRRLLTQRDRARLSVEAQARLRERARIAHDMHDSLGHDLALIAVRAAGLEVSPGLSPAQTRAAGELREAAGQATERLRQIVGLLRDDVEPAPLTPVDEDLAALVGRARASGMAVTLHVSGEPVPGVAHRVVQEGLTNAAKHAPGAPVVVTVSPTLVAVRNGPSRARPTAVPGGMGLTGLRERVRLAGGTLEAGPDGGGFALSVHLPG